MVCGRVFKKVREAVLPRIKALAKVVVTFANRLKNVENNGDSKKTAGRVSKESIRSRVAMDFTGRVGRIVDDPQEANAIAVGEGYSWKRRWRPSTRLLGPSAAAQAHIQTLEAAVHITQPWFHSGMTRDQANELMARHGTNDGVFLVRESHSNRGSFVLTYKHGSRVFHAQITPIFDPLGDRPLYSLDNGATRFYDILQLVEFYQLNTGSLPTRLTHYIVQNGNTVVVPTPFAQRTAHDQQASTSSSASPGRGAN
ncbi:hypothetical protein NQ315_004822 [Exocentrus adspersus]|uniref:SH2 domain-containing protein n=1 Tax=Exocentrus adspersus TaxID=1586481 RepID=A0AAV8W2G6_9CUCU|nr:hypothetical protein NQ315_004822 [Exocentrus adspersus]